MDEINPMSPMNPVSPAVDLTQLKLQLTQAAMCHEYARMEYGRAVCLLRRGELLEEMALYHDDYQVARDHLAKVEPALLDQIELELRSQKQLVFSQYH